ncbi:MAG: hypothetical protein J6L03_05525 [Bacteroidaceae bacterium]|nr:hypothetical protein [Bacteroidaceae bacterium]
MNIITILITALLTALLTSLLISIPIANMYKIILEWLDTETQRDTLLRMFSREVARLRGDADWDKRFAEFCQQLHRNKNTKQ